MDTRGNKAPLRGDMSSDLVNAEDVSSGFVAAAESVEDFAAAETSGGSPDTEDTSGGSVVADMISVPVVDTDISVQNIIDFLASETVKLTDQEVCSAFEKHLRPPATAVKLNINWDFNTALPQLCAYFLATCMKPTKIVVEGDVPQENNVLWGFARGFHAHVLLLHVKWDGARFESTAVENIEGLLHTLHLKLQERAIPEQVDIKGNFLDRVVRELNRFLDAYDKYIRKPQDSHAAKMKALHSDAATIKILLEESIKQSMKLFQIVAELESSLKKKLCEHAEKCKALGVNSAIFGLDDVQSKRLIGIGHAFTEEIYRIQQHNGDEKPLTAELKDCNETIIVGGDSGTGKTTLLMHFAERIRKWLLEGKSPVEAANTVCITTMLRPIAKPGEGPPVKKPEVALKTSGAVCGVIDVKKLNDYIVELNKSLDEELERRAKIECDNVEAEIKELQKNAAADQTKIAELQNKLQKMRKDTIAQTSCETVLSWIHENVIKSEQLTASKPKSSNGATRKKLPQLSEKEFVAYACEKWIGYDAKHGDPAYQTIIRNAVWSYHIFYLVKEVLGEEVFGLLQLDHKLHIVFLLCVDEAGGHTDMCRALCASKDWIQRLICHPGSNQMSFYSIVSGTGVGTGSMPPGSLPGSYCTVTCVDTGAHVLTARLKTQANISNKRIETVLNTIAAHSFLRDLSNNARTAALFVDNIVSARTNGVDFFFRDEWVASTLLPQLALAAVAAFRTKNGLAATNTPDDVLWILWNSLQLFLYPKKKSDDIVDMLACTYGVVTDKAVWRRMSRKDAEKEHELWDWHPKDLSEDETVECLVTAKEQSRIAGNCSSFAILISLWLAEVLESSVSGEGMEKSGMFTQLLWVLASQGMPMNLALDVLRTGKPQFQNKGVSTLFPTLTLASVRYPADPKELEGYLNELERLDNSSKDPPTTLPTNTSQAPPKLLPLINVTAARPIACSQKAQNNSEKRSQHQDVPVTGTAAAEVPESTAAAEQVCVHAIMMPPKLPSADSIVGIRNHLLVLIQAKDYLRGTSPLSFANFYNELFKMGHRGPESIAGHFAATWRDPKNSKFKDLVAAVNWLGIEAKDKAENILSVAKTAESNQGEEARPAKKGKTEVHNNPQNVHRMETTTHEEVPQSVEDAKKKENERRCKELEDKANSVKLIQQRIAPDDIMYLLLECCPPNDHTPIDLNTTLAKRSHFVMGTTPTRGKKPFLKGIEEANEVEANHAELCELKAMLTKKGKNDAPNVTKPILPKNAKPMLNNNVYVVQAHDDVQDKSLLSKLLPNIQFIRRIGLPAVEVGTPIAADCRDEEEVQDVPDPVGQDDDCSKKRSRNGFQNEEDWGTKFRKYFNVSDEYVSENVANHVKPICVNKVQYILHCSLHAANNFFVDKDTETKLAEDVNAPATAGTVGKEDRPTMPPVPKLVPKKRQVNVKLLPPNVGIILCDSDGKVFDGVVPIGKRVAHHMNNIINPSLKFFLEIKR